MFEIYRITFSTDLHVQRIYSIRHITVTWWQGGNVIKQFAGFSPLDVDTQFLTDFNLINVFSIHVRGNRWRSGMETHQYIRLPSSTVIARLIRMSHT